MSGRWLTLAVVSICVALVLVALWRRSRDTSRIREFWGASNARLIQHAPKVALRVDEAALASDAPSLDGARAWRDISRAPGLVHLRATLVDDRYFDWPARTATEEERVATGPAIRVLRFSGAEGLVDVAIDVERGTVVHLAVGRAVAIIPASRAALAAYLQKQHE